MLLIVSTTHRPATDLGFLLHKHPGRVQEFRQSFGAAVIFYPEADEERCTAALLLDVDPVRLARSRPRNAPDSSLAQYVNDRPYAASSLLALALGDVFSTARGGRCAARPDLPAQPLPLRIEIPVLPCRGGPDLARRLFAPLGWDVTATPIPLDPQFPQWGDSRYVNLALTGTLRLADALNQLYVLLPALDESKHYWQGADEVDKLMRSGAGWLADHPDRDLIARRYLGRHGGLARLALDRLTELDDALPEDEVTEPEDPQSEGTTKGSDAPVASRPLNAHRQDAVRDVLRQLGATSVIDLGCGPGHLLARCSARPSSRAWRAATSRRAHCSKQRGGCAWTSSATASGPGSSSSRVRSRTRMPASRGTTRRSSWRSSSMSTRLGSGRWSAWCLARPGPARWS